MSKALAIGLILAASQRAPPPSVLRFSPRPNHAAEIQWRAFGPAAFEEAKAAHKPLFLNLAAVWCHWCHVFDETTLSDPKVVAILNASFVPMRVDADQNPEVERRYLLGGWPSNAFLDEQGAVLGGGTYIPPPRFLQMAQRVVEGYAGDRAKLRAELGDSHPPPQSELSPAELGPAVATSVAHEIRRAVDHEHGGFGGAPKFPQGSALALLAYVARTRGDAGAMDDCKLALDRMAQGEIFDPVEGGFFRYATRADWGAPHYEKMLATNAELLMAYSEAYAASHDESLRGPASSIVSYLVTHLWDDGAGGFYASQDADETYYKLDAAGRAKLKAPFIDRTFLADRMGFAARALIRAAAVFGEPDFARYAKRTEDLVLTRMRASDGLVQHALAATPNAKATGGGIGDQAQTALALLDLAGYMGDSKYLRAAGGVLGAAQRVLANQAGPGFFDAPTNPKAAGLTATRLQPMEENALLAWALIRLGELDGDEALIARGRETLGAFAGNAHGLAAAEFARVVDELSGQALRVLVVGPAKSEATRALLAAAIAFDDPRREVRLLEAGPHGAKLGGLEFPAGAPAVYACAGTVCSRPIRDASALEAELRAFVEAHLK
ncbi:MAG: thioredoxin domain-containing protein [Deltaproteobacteria bacterium]|nr:thioredoxin domain-containing protein [Deltaproteobacteria bacterium]